MKRKSFYHRQMSFPALFVRPIANRQSNLARAVSVSGQPGIRTGKVFVIEQTRRLPSRNAAAKKIRRILIFDNHPDSLRLVFGRHANPPVDLSLRQRASLWDLILVSMLTIGVLIGMFWPIF